MRHHEFEDPDGIELVSLANQAAAFARISRSWRNCRTSRLRRRSSSCSAPVTPSMQRPDRRSDCFTQLWVV